MGLLVTAGLTLRLATFSAQFSLFSACTSVLLLRTLYHQNGKTGTTYWPSTDEILPVNRDIKQVQVFFNTPATLSENVSQRGEMNGDRWREVVGGIYSFVATDNQKALALWLSASDGY